MVAALALCAIPAGAMAADNIVQLIVGGEAYDGPPRFEVSFDGKVLGEAAVEAAIDTATAGRFADAADKAAYVQSFSFRCARTMCSSRAARCGCGWSTKPMAVTARTATATCSSPRWP